MSSVLPRVIGDAWLSSRTSGSLSVMTVLTAEPPVSVNFGFPEAGQSLKTSSVKVTAPLDPFE